MTKHIAIVGFAALLAGACEDGRTVESSDGPSNDPVRDELQRGKQAAETAAGKFCACATDLNNQMCKSSPAMCFSSLSTCKQTLLSVPYEQYDAQTTDCLAVAYKLTQSESLTYLKCIHAATDFYSACMDKVQACDYNAVVTCENDRQGEANKCKLLPEHVRAAIRACTGAHDAGV
jgi:hypothetical protein